MLWAHERKEVSWKGSTAREGTYGTEVGVLHNVIGHHAVLRGQRHDKEQSIPSLLAYCALSMNEGYQKGEDEEVGSPLVLAGVKEELQNGWVFGKDGAELVEQDNQLSLHGGGGCPRAGAQQHHQGLQDGLMVQQGLVRLGDQHLVHLQLLQFGFVSEFPPQAPEEELLHDVLTDHKLQNRPHRSILGLLFNEQEQHVFYIVLHSAGLIWRDGSIFCLGVLQGVMLL